MARPRGAARVGMSPEELERLGLEAFGPQWKSPLARALNPESPDPRAIRRYAAGEVTIPPGTAELIRAACAKAAATRFDNPVPERKSAKPGSDAP